MTEMNRLITALQTFFVEEWPRVFQDSCQILVLRKEGKGLTLFLLR